MIKEGWILPQKVELEEFCRNKVSWNFTMNIRTYLFWKFIVVAFFSTLQFYHFHSIFKFSRETPISTKHIGQPIPKLELIKSRPASSPIKQIVQTLWKQKFGTNVVYSRCEHYFYMKTRLLRPEKFVNITTSSRSAINYIKYWDIPFSFLYLFLGGKLYCLPAKSKY